jgi:hypothetical protein
MLQFSVAFLTTFLGSVGILFKMVISGKFDTIESVAKVKIVSQLGNRNVDFK